MEDVEERGLAWPDWLGKEMEMRAEDNYIGKRAAELFGELEEEIADLKSGRMTPEESRRRGRQSANKKRWRPSSNAWGAAVIFTVG
jgi:hypothetical protein